MSTTEIDSKTGLWVNLFPKILLLFMAMAFFSFGERTALAEDICGDGFITGAEQCDDFNNFPGDGCSETCTVEPGWFCDPFFGCFTICGDGIQAGFEECDDEFIANGDGCDNDPFNGGNCTFTRCGNFVVTEGETCDDGGFTGGCSETCQVNPGWDCSLGFFCFPICGDGMVVGFEICDDEFIANGDGCDNDVANGGNCTLTACGNFVLTEGEVCDDGNTADADPALNDNCDSNCTPPTCGNGVANAVLGEECDDGNNANGDGCDRNCTPTGCGNGVRANEEECDDGNTESDDGCSSECSVECGDGAKGINEECDDGNVRSGDGCSGVCTLEFQKAVCGNNLLEAGEECDDGNETGGDGCEANCTDQAFESANPNVDFGNLILDETVSLNAPDPRSSSGSLFNSGTLPIDCSCVWNYVPSTAGVFSATNTSCHIDLTPLQAGEGTLAVEVDCGASGSGRFIQLVSVQETPVAGGCSLVR